MNYFTSAAFGTIPYNNRNYGFKFKASYGKHQFMSNHCGAVVPAMFDYDYQKMREEATELRQQLLKVVMAPEHIHLLANKGLL